MREAPANASRSLLREAPRDLATGSRIELREHVDSHSQVSPTINLNKLTCHQSACWTRQERSQLGHLIDCGRPLHGSGLANQIFFDVLSRLVTVQSGSDNRAGTNTIESHPVAGPFDGEGAS